MNTFYHYLCEVMVGLGLTLIAVMVCLSLAPEAQPQPRPVPPSAKVHDGYSSDQILIAMTVWGEARGSSPVDQIEIARVIQNRVRDPRYPDTVRGVVFQPKQFSCWNADDPNFPKLRRIPQDDPEGFMEILNRVKDVQPDGISLNYHAIRMENYPAWAAYGRLPRDIGQHRFYAGAWL